MTRLPQDTQPRTKLRTRLLCATAAGLGAWWVGARMPPGVVDLAGIVQPVVHAAVPPAPPASAASSAADAPSPRASNVSDGRSDGALSLVQRERSIPSADGDAFAKLSWQPPPPPPPPPPPVAMVMPPAPVAPPLPFTFVGMVEQGAGKPQAFLAKGDALLVVAAGDVIENKTYRIDSLSATAVVLTFLPMDKQQTISVSGGSK